ncbi:MAG: D-amino-acid transaminase [Pseudomonadota bacterium]
MSRIAHVNGAFVRLADAGVHIEDRGYQFADGVYEVCLVLGGQFVDMDAHLDRLARSLKALEIAAPMSRKAHEGQISELLRRNRLRDSLVYIQVTRGSAPRNHLFPTGDVPPSLVMTARRFDPAVSNATAKRGVNVITQPDIRWGRVDINSLSLLPNVLAKQAAAQAGAAEAWLVRDEAVTECSASNAWIVDDSGAIHTHPLTNEILGGVTRARVVRCAAELQIPIVETAFSLEDARGAAEAFMTSATQLVMPVVGIDGVQIGDGAPGPVAIRLREAYVNSLNLSAESLN